MFKLSDTFASCSKDGSICIWDKRITKGPRIRVQRAHDLLLYSEEKQPLNCLIHVDEHTLATGGGTLMRFVLSFHISNCNSFVSYLSAGSVYGI